MAFLIHFGLFSFGGEIPRVRVFRAYILFEINALRGCKTGFEKSYAAAAVSVPSGHPIDLLARSSARWSQAASMSGCRVKILSMIPRVVGIGPKVRRIVGRFHCRVRITPHIFNCSAHSWCTSIVPLSVAQDSGGRPTVN
jgi:hypothetical protein